MTGFRDMLDGTMASNAGISAARPASSSEKDTRFAEHVTTQLLACKGLSGVDMVVGNGRVR